MRRDEHSGGPRIAIDAMGGYRAPEAAVRAAATASLRAEFQTVLVGDAAAIDGLLGELPHNPERLSVEHVPGRIPMDARPEQVMTRFADSSLVRCAELLAAGEADAVVTAGSPSIAMTAMAAHVPRLDGVERGAVAAVVPTRRRRGEKDDPFSLLLDIGVTDHATAGELVTFALMGAAYARCISRNPCPRVALLASSPEPTVGPPALVEAHQELLRRSDGRHFTFIGNVEGHQIPAGDADVVVCEGLLGAVVVRLLEGIADAAVDLARAAYEQKLKWRLGLSMLSSGLEQLRKLTEWNEYGGAPLLGLARPVLVAQADSGELAMHNATRVAAKAVRDRLTTRIEANLK